jgi:hypothetical protein
VSTNHAELRTRDAPQSVHEPLPEEPPETPPWADLAERLNKAERQSRWLKYTLLVMAPLLVYVFIGQELPEQLVRRETLVSGDRMQLFDASGNPRLYMRVYSGVPVVQLIDENGKPRLSLGLRYDDSPFISLSDVAGQTRATLQLGEDDAPALKLFDENGESSFTAR